MRLVFLVAILGGAIVGGAVAGGRAFWPESTPPASETAPPIPDPGSAGEVAAQFAAAWSDADIDAMYALLPPSSRETLRRAEFAGEYQSFMSEVTGRSLQAQFVGLDRAAARLSVHLRTGYFGDLDYAVVLNLVRAGGDWFVAWDRTAIHPELVNGSAFRSTIERPRRGAIYDRNGVALAVTQELRILGLNRARVVDRDATRAALIEFGYSAAAVDAAFASSLGQDQLVAIGPIADERAEAAFLLPDRHPGVVIFSDTRRVHPLGASAAHAVGYTREMTAGELAATPGKGLRPGDRIGATGLEAAFNDRLAGSIGAELRLLDAEGTTLRVYESRPFRPGEDILTSLDAEILKAAQARLGRRTGAAVAIDPRTNQVVAINSNPTFDPDVFERGDAAGLAAINLTPNGPLLNRAVSGLYSAGSTFKLITGAAGLLHGVVTTTDRLVCGATWAGIQPARRNWEGAQGSLTVAEGLMRSCNPVFYEIALRLHTTLDGALSETARKFGFGSLTGAGFVEEEPALVPDAAWKKAARGEGWFAGDEVNLGIGQGDLLITPIQLANAYSTFATGTLRDVTVLAGGTGAGRGPVGLSPEQHAHLLQGLRLVTGPNGTASAAFAALGFTQFAGKSGTAEDFGQQQHVLFATFAPYDAPRVVVAVVLDEGQSGSTEAGPIARDIALAALNRDR